MVGDDDHIQRVIELAFDQAVDQALDRCIDDAKFGIEFIGIRAESMPDRVDGIEIKRHQARTLVIRQGQPVKNPVDTRDPGHLLVIA